MSDDPTLRYLDARSAYDVALKDVRGLSTKMTIIASAIGKDVGGFLDTTIDGKPSTIYTRHDLTRWPTGDDIKAAVLKLRDAFEGCRKAWEAVPHDRQAGCVKPPDKIGAG